MRRRVGRISLVAHAPQPGSRSAGQRPPGRIPLAEYTALLARYSLGAGGLLDERGRFLYASPAYRQLAGTPDLAGASLFTLIHPEDRRAAQAAWDLALASGSSEATVRYYRADQGWLWGKTHLRAIRYRHLRAVVCVIYDVTEQRAAEEALRASEERYRRLVEHSPEPIAIHQGGNVVFVNAAAVRLVGAQKPEDLLGRPLLSFVHPDDHPKVLARVRQTQQAAYPAELAEERFVRLDGQTVDVEVVALPTIYGGDAATQVIVRDITARKRAEAALYEEQQRLRLALEAARMGIWDWDVQTGSLTWSPNLEPLHGFAPGTFDGTFEAFQQRIHPEDLERVNAAIAEAVRDCSHYSVEFRIVWPDGSVRWMAGQGQAFSDPAGRPARMIGLGIDITDRKVAEEGLRFLAEASAALTASLDYQTTLVTLAQLAVPRLGDYCAIHMIDADAGPQPAAGAGTAAPAADALRSGQPQIAAGARPGWLGAGEAPDEDSGQMLVVPLRIRERMLGTLTLAYSDRGRRHPSHERALAHELASRAALAVENTQLYAAELRTREATLRVAQRIASLQAITAALAAALTPADVAASIIEQGMRALGADAGAVVVRAPDDSYLEVVRSVGFPDELVEAWKRFPDTTLLPVVDAIRTGQPVWLSTHAECVERYPLIMLGSPLGSPRARVALPLLVEGQAIGALGLGFAEEQLFLPEERDYMLSLAQQCAQAFERARLYDSAQQARQAAEAAVRLRDVFLSVAAHELKTPLTSLLGNGQLLQRRAAREGSFSERDQRSLGVIVAQAERLNQLVTMLLDISRLEQGRLTIERVPLDLGALALRVVEEIRPNLAQHTLGFHAPPEPVVVVGDALRLEQVLQNLIDNAIKYSPHGGLVEVTLDRQGAEATLSVRDPGIGIPEAALPQLFSRFYRADNVDERQISGMGIGLYVVKEVVALHDGTISVESVENEGTMVVVHLPLAL